MTIVEVGKAIINLLWNDIKQDSQLKTIIANKEQISLAAPKETELGKNEKLSIFLYRITEFMSLKNSPSPASGPSITNPSIDLVLHYLVTPQTESVETDQLLLDKIIQIFATNSKLQELAPPSGATDVRITMDPFSIEELTKLWTALGTPYKLSLSYSTAPLRMQSETKRKAEKVIILKRELPQTTYPGVYIEEPQEKNDKS